MKKIFLLLITIYSFSFSSIYSDYVSGKICTVDSISSSYSNQAYIDPCVSHQGWFRVSGAYVGYTTTTHSLDTNNICKRTKGSLVKYTNCRTPTSEDGENPPTGLCQGKSLFSISGDLYSCSESDGMKLIPNPQNNGNSRCDELFEKDGIYHSCNPNTNESRPEPNLLLTPNESGEIEPSCSGGKTYSSTSKIGSNADGSEYTPFVDRGCYDSVSPDGGSGSGSGSDSGSDSGSSDPVTVTNPDGSTTMTMPDGTTYNTTGDGTVTVNYPDGTSTSSGGGGGSSGGSGGGGAGTGATTPTETGETGTDTPYEPLPVASSCSDSALTLQEKMLCELNQGMKNQNSEANPTNSLNNLLKDLNVDNNKTGEAINKNIKSSNDNLSLINKNINETNKNLGAVAAKQNASNVYLKNVDQNISDIKGTINDSSFSDTSTSGTLNTMKEDNEGILDSAKEAYSNLSNTYDSIKANYQSLKDFVDGKKSENSTIDISAVTLPKKQVTIFGKTLSMDCFFNQDLNTLFAPIRPFVTFMLNIFFVFISIKLFMNYALSNRGGIV